MIVLNAGSPARARIDQAVAEREWLREADRKQRLAVAVARAAALQRAAEALRGTMPRAEYLNILDEVAERHGLTRADILSKGRTGKVAAARLETYYQLLLRTKLSTIQIGHRLGRDHSSVVSGCKRHCDKNCLAQPREQNKTGPNDYYHLALTTNLSLREIAQQTGRCYDSVVAGIRRYCRENGVAHPRGGVL